MYKITCFYHEEDNNRCFGTIPPRIYIKQTDIEPTSDILDDMFWEMIEIECIPTTSRILIEKLIEKDGKRFDYNFTVVDVDVVRTKNPSKYIIWGSKTPNIFEVDRSASSYSVKI